MIRATELAGQPVVDIDAAEKLGVIEKLILDAAGTRIAGFIVVRGGFPGRKEHTTIPAASVYAVGTDAVTVKRADIAVDTAGLETLPKASDVIGRKVVTDDGRYLGKVGDLLIERSGGRIFGYILADHKGEGKHPYLPADANLKIGPDLIVAAESALRYEWKDEKPADKPGQWCDL